MCMYWGMRRIHIFFTCLSQWMSQALFWLSLKALGPDGGLDPAELIIREPPSPVGSAGAGDQPSSGDGSDEESTDRSNNEGPAPNSTTKSDSCGPGKKRKGRKAPKPQSVAVVCLPGEEELLGRGICGPVYAGR
jgi:hypothetical protein